MIGDIFPELRFTVIDGEAERQYLGLAQGAKAFSVSEVDSQYLLVVVYDEMCLTCRMELDTLKQFFGEHPTSEIMGTSFKLLGIAAGSTNRAVSKYRRQEKVPFPLAADEKRQLFHLLGSPDLPTLYLLKRGDRQSLVLWVYSQQIKTPENLALMLSEFIDRDKSQDSNL